MRRPTQDDKSSNVLWPVGWIARDHFGSDKDTREGVLEEFPSAPHVAVRRESGGGRIG
jgi:hypothetical protein